MNKKKSLLIIVSVLIVFLLSSCNKASMKKYTKLMNSEKLDFDVSLYIKSENKSMNVNKISYIKNKDMTVIDLTNTLEEKLKYSFIGQNVILENNHGLFKQSVEDFNDDFPAISFLLINDLDFNKCIKDIKEEDTLSFSYDLYEFLSLFNLFNKAKLEVVSGRKIDVECSFKGLKIDTIEYDITSLLDFIVYKDYEIKEAKMIFKVNRYKKDLIVPDLNNYLEDQKELEYIANKFSYYIDPETEFNVLDTVSLVGEPLSIKASINSEIITSDELIIKGDYDINFIGEYPVTIKYYVFNRVFSVDTNIKIEEPEYIIEAEDIEYKYMFERIYPELNFKFYDKLGYDKNITYIDNSCINILNLDEEKEGLQKITLSYIKDDYTYTTDINVMVYPLSTKKEPTIRLDVKFDADRLNICYDKYLIFSGNTNSVYEDNIYKCNLETMQIEKSISFDYIVYNWVIKDNFAYIITCKDYDIRYYIVKLDLDNFEVVSTYEMDKRPVKFFVDKDDIIYVLSAYQNEYYEINQENNTITTKPITDSKLDVQYVKATDQLLVNTFKNKLGLALLDRTVDGFLLNDVSEYIDTSYGSLMKAYVNDQYCLYINNYENEGQGKIFNFIYIDLNKPEERNMVNLDFNYIDDIKKVSFIDVTMDENNIYFLYEKGNYKFLIIYDLINKTYQLKGISYSTIRYETIIVYNDCIYLIISKNVQEIIPIQKQYITGKD